MKKLLALGVFVALVLAWFFLANAGSDEVRSIDPVSASISENGSILSVQVPHVGGCARRTHDVYYDVDGDTLVVWVEAVGEGEFSCLAECLGDPCTEELTLRLDEPVDPATPIIFREPGPGILGGAIVVLLGLMAAIAVVMFLLPSLGNGRRTPRPEYELPPYEPDSE
jgi:hypothetical protein